MILLDATAFSLLVNPDAKPPKDPATGQPVIKAKERFQLLEAEAQRHGETIIIPTPALAEVLVRLGDAAPAVLDRVAKSSRFKIEQFDIRAAIEVASMTREAIRSGDKRAGSSSPWQKVKIDRQIIAIARVHGVQCIYSDDDGITKFASDIGMPVVHTWTMPLPPEDPQQNLFEDTNTG